ncbi:hypothetical protein ZIOFF_009652 [Zingiber officinale]|uniref:CCHC-type domain-containing protein n=1 Tax=Zingiber officinale TaxID=94328 RepID=A0A8J5I317_ZINOF|nr:hypothetical protein ZIOFF_009652 [Zingiber officinale]
MTSMEEETMIVGNNFDFLETTDIVWASHATTAAATNRGWSSREVRSVQVSQMVQPSCSEPGLSEGADANSQRRDQLALGQIHQGVDYSIFGLIANAKTAKEAWDTLKLSYKGVDRAQKSKLQSLRRLYDRCEMSSTETVEHYFSRLTDLVNKMRLYGDKIGDDAVVEKILRTIPLKYDHVVASIQESHDIELLTIAELKGMIESHIDRIEAKTETPTNEEALKSQVTLNTTDSSQRGGGFNRGRGRARRGYRGRGRGNYSNQGRSGDNAMQERFSAHCYNCGKYGHKIADCRYKKFNNHGNQANIAGNYGVFFDSSSFECYQDINYTAV